MNTIWVRVSMAHASASPLKNQALPPRREKADRYASRTQVKPIIWPLYQTRPYCASMKWTRPESEEEHQDGALGFGKAQETRPAGRPQELRCQTHIERSYQRCIKHIIELHAENRHQGHQCDRRKRRPVKIEPPIKEHQIIHVRRHDAQPGLAVQKGVCQIIIERLK